MIFVLSKALGGGIPKITSPKLLDLGTQGGGGYCGNAPTLGLCLTFQRFFEFSLSSHRYV